MPIAPLDQVDIHYLELDNPAPDVSDSIPLIMVHGLGANLAFWYHLAPDFLPLVKQIVLFDLRGHGRSSMPPNGYTAADLTTDLIQLMDYLKIDQAHLIGHSFGGAVVLNCACDHSNRVSSLVLADVRLRLMQPMQRLQDWHQWAKYRTALEAAGVGLDPTDPESGYQLLQELAQSQLRQPGQPNPLKDLLSPFSGKSGKRTATRWLKLLETSTAKADFLEKETFSIAQLVALKQPKLAIYGEHSQAVATAKGLQEIWPTMELIMIPEAGHFFPMSCPQKFVQSTKIFLKKIAQ